MKNQQGFTITELLIATAVFSVILLLCTVGLMQVGRLFYKGVTSTRTQEIARMVMDDISQAIQFSGGPIINPITNTGVSPDISQGLCVGGRRYSYSLNTQLTGSGHALMGDDYAGCNSLTPAQNLTAPAGLLGRELLATNIRLVTLNVTCVNTTAVPGVCANNTYRVVLRIVAGDNDVLADKLKADGTVGTDGILDSCSDIQAGSQFCAAAELNSIVQRRIL